MSLLIQSAVLVLYFSAYQFRAFTINNFMPVWAVWLLTLVMIDFIFYWYHRSAHRIRFLWAIHMNHHSSIEMNFSVAFRQAWFGPISKTPFYIIMPLLGFDPSITVVVALFSRLWGVLGHTQWVDSNYGNLLIVWDRMFGTYVKETSPVVFGLVKNIGTNNPVVITFHTWFAMSKDIKRAKSFYEVLGYIFGPPDWRAWRCLCRRADALHLHIRCSPRCWFSASGVL